MEITAGIFFGGDNENVLTACYLLGFSDKEFVSFLCWDNGQNILTEKSLSIHVENGNIYFMIILVWTKIFTIFWWLNKKRP